MQNEVFANDLEIACKAAEGLSRAALPDPCWTPPPPKAGWILVTYVNTAFAKDTTNASKSVFITGKPVMLKDKSYFKTSIGNEPAAGPKGFHTGAKLGKAYFRSWSMNVKIEGYNVDRHTDTMTHNHNPKKGNTARWHYYDERWYSSPCSREFDKVESACDDRKNKKRKIRKNIKWKQKNCAGLNITPLSPNSRSPDDLLSQVESQFKSINIDDALTSAMSDLMSELQSMGAMFVGKQVLKKVPVVGWAWQALTIKDDIEAVAHLKDVWTASSSEAERIKNQVSGLSDRLGSIKTDLEALKNGGLSETARTELGGKVQNEVADLQRTIATLNSCTRARKCLLVPYRQKRPGKKTYEDFSKDKDSIEGCCPGQTKHHLIPSTFMKGSPCGKEYHEEDAPTVCAEGTGHSHGSHGSMHTGMNVFGSRKSDSSSNISYQDAREAAIKSHVDTFPLSLCSPDCLREQLDAYYQNMIKCSDDAKLKFKKIGKDNEEMPRL